MFEVVQSYHLQYWETVSSFSESEHCLLVGCCVFYTTINGETLHLVFSFHTQGFKSWSDIESKFHQGVMEIVSHDSINPFPTLQYG